MTRVYIIRHGQVVGHDEFRYNGHSNVDITAEGYAQMERIAEFLSCRPVKAVYSSDLVRAVKGAHIVAGRFGVKPHVDAELRELHLGRWEGLTRSEAIEKFPEDAELKFTDLAAKKISGGETLPELGARVLPAMGRILGRHRGEEVAIVAHGGVNRVVLCDAMGLPLENFFHIEQDYGCLNVIDYLTAGNYAVVKVLNGGPNVSLEKTFIY